MKIKNLIISAIAIYGLVSLWAMHSCFAQGEAQEKTSEVTLQKIDENTKADASKSGAQGSQDYAHVPSNFDIASTYTIGPDDVIEVGVLRHPELSGKYVISKEGKIQYEFVGDLLVNGMTKEALTEHIKKALTEYIISPEVTVKIDEYNSKIVYVVGEVANPGKIIMRGDTITVNDALIQAGLPLLSAKVAKSLLITPADNGHAKQKKVNVYKLLYQGDLRENLVMHPGDTLYVPPTFLAKVMRTISPVTQPIGNVAGTGKAVAAF